MTKTVDSGVFMFDFIPLPVLPGGGGGLLGRKIKKKEKKSIK
jgi:hypothetical protein